MQCKTRNVSGKIAAQGNNFSSLEFRAKLPCIVFCSSAEFLRCSLRFDLQFAVASIQFSSQCNLAHKTVCVSLVAVQFGLRSLRELQSACDAHLQPLADSDERSQAFCAALLAFRAQFTCLKFQLCSCDYSSDTQTTAARVASCNSSCCAQTRLASTARFDATTTAQQQQRRQRQQRQQRQQQQPRNGLLCCCRTCCCRVGQV